MISVLEVGLVSAPNFARDGTNMTEELSTN